MTLTPEMRRRLPFLGHLPVHCDIAFLELDMSNIVSPETSQKFQQGITGFYFTLDSFSVLWFSVLWFSVVSEGDWLSKRASRFTLAVVLTLTLTLLVL